MLGMTIGRKIGDSDRRFMHKLRTLRFMSYLISLSLICPIAPAHGAFDPVNDDTDLFRNNPNIPSERPNVLIILDNSANWSSGGKFLAEKTALVNTVAALDSSFNVGMSIMGQGGGCKSGNVDGMYIRFGIRQMTATNKAALQSLIGSTATTGFIDSACASSGSLAGDQGSNTTGGQSMHEAYLYFSGLTSRSGITQAKRDYAGNANNTTAGSLAGNPLAGSSATTYTSPITDSCQKNYIIFISNGPFDNSDDNPSSTLYAGTDGLVPGATPIALSPNGSQSNWFDEYAFYLATSGVTVGGRNSKVFTYAVEVDPSTTGQGPGHTALMKSGAQQGQGKYFGVTSGSAGAAISEALTSIFSEIQAVNSVFAASTLPVSVNVRGTNLNQLYIGVFRPDSSDRPRWFGNLKAYQLKKDPNTGLVFTVDKLGNVAENSTTGFITGNATSFWTSSTLSPTNYWAFRPSSVNGTGGSSDAPDGDLVEKGGAGQQIRAKFFANSVNGDPLDITTPIRALYTCTTGAYGTCTTGSLLSNTPFIDANVDIDAAALALDTHPVTPLTAAIVKPVSALTDTRAVVLSNALAGALPVSGIVTNTTTQSVSSINNTRTFSVSTIDNGAVSFALTGLSKANGANKVHTLVSASNMGLSTGSKFVVTGTTNYNVSPGTVISVSSDGKTITEGSYSTNIATETAGTLTRSNTTVNATTTTAHGFAVGDTVTIAGATPSNFNGDKILTAASGTSFSWQNEAVASAPTGTITVTGRGTTATATTPVAHGLSVGQTVTIAGATPSGYNRIGEVITAVTTSAPFTFSYSTGTTQTSAASGTLTVSYSGTTATATVPGHTFTNLSSVAIAGANQSGFNNTFSIFNVAGNNFDFTVPAGLGTATGTITAFSASATQATVTATLANHGFTTAAPNNAITIGGVTTAGHNGDFTVLSVPDANTFTYSTSSALASPAGSPTVRLTSSPLAYATITGHGYGAAGTSVSNLTIAGANPTGYNANYNATVVDANTVSLPLSTALGVNTGSSVTATTGGTVATATSAAHGFLAGVTTVTISGASPTGFNGAVLVQTVPTVDTFTYNLLDPSTPLKTASGIISAVSAGAGTSERTNVINWIRGMDNYEDENGNSSLADTRTTIQGDVLHSRPAVVNYNRRCTRTDGSLILPCTASVATDPANLDNDVYIYYGGNDGIFRALKGGFGSSTGDPSPGLEVWGFVVPEHFPTLRRLRLNSPAISSNFKKPYFFDGPIGTYTLDANNDGKLEVSGTINPADATQDKVWLFLSMRRGGRFMYALNVTNPLAPTLLWRKGCPSLDATLAPNCDLGWEELGQTWSEPKIVKSDASSDPLLFFGAGYDANVEDIDPSTITEADAEKVKVGSLEYTRSQGRGIYVVNARTGDIVWQASGHSRVSAPSGFTTPSHAYKVVSGMDYSIPGDIAVVVGDSTPKPFRAYIGDTGGQMWRMDFGNADPAYWTVTKLASIADQTTAAGRRKFMAQADVVGASGFDAVIAGTGDREHPFDTTVTNRVYMFKDKNSTTTPPLTGTGTPLPAAITEGTGTGAPMFDVTSNCIQDASGCTGVAPQLAGSGNTASQNAAAALNASSNYGWYLSLASGEKQVGSTLASGGGAVQFGTNQPSASAGGGACSPNLGVARKYTVNFADGSAFADQNASDTLTTADRSVSHAGGGFLPSPVLVFVNLGGTSGTGASSTTGVPVGGTVVGSQLSVGGGAGVGTDATGVVCFGANCSLAPGTQLYSRLRKFWYKELD